MSYCYIKLKSDFKDLKENDILKVDEFFYYKSYYISDYNKFKRFFINSNITSVDLNEYNSNDEYNDTSFFYQLSTIKIYFDNESKQLIPNYNKERYNYIIQGYNYYACYVSMNSGIYYIPSMYIETLTVNDIRIIKLKQFIK